MTINVLVVDDSSFFRGRITEILNSNPLLKVVGTANNGQEAIRQTLILNPDIITMDYEMPRMDGITAIREIMEKKPTPILMFSSLSYEGARTTLDALSAGAVDFLPKNFESVSKDAQANQVLIDRVMQIAKPCVDQIEALAPLDVEKNSNTHQSDPLLSIQNAQNETSVVEAKPGLENKYIQKSIQVDSTLSAPMICASSKPLRIVAIGASTGGPIAVQNILKELPATLEVPILIIQHMPAAFTKAYADRLDKICSVRVLEAEEGMRLAPGHVYVAPGGKQTLITNQNGMMICLREDDRLDYKPSVDLTFASLSKASPNSTLAIVMTGMGSDGTDGARLLHESGSTVWIQDAASCVVNGMPLSVRRAGYYHSIVTLDSFAKKIKSAVSASQ